MSWIGVITNAGTALLAQWAQGGHTLTIDKATIGSGFREAINLRTAIALVSEEAEAQIVSAKQENSGTLFRIRAKPSQTDAYIAHEIGIWGHIDDGTVTLIAIHQDADTGVEIPTEETMPSFQFDLYCLHAIGNEGELTVNIAESVYPTMDEMNEAVGAIESQVAAEEETDTASEDYAVNEFLIFEGKLYKVTAAITVGDTLEPGANIEEATIGGELDQLQTTVDSMIQQSAFEIVVEDNEYILYWHGAEDECPYEITLENGEYVLNYIYNSVS